MGADQSPGMTLSKERFALSFIQQAFFGLLCCPRQCGKSDGIQEEDFLSISNSPWQQGKMLLYRRVKVCPKMWFCGFASAHVSLAKQVTCYAQMRREWGVPGVST